MYYVFGQRRRYEYATLRNLISNTFQSYSNYCLKSKTTKNKVMPLICHVKQKRNIKWRLMGNDCDRKKFLFIGSCNQIFNNGMANSFDEMFENVKTLTKNNFVIWCVWIENNFNTSNTQGFWKYWTTLWNIKILNLLDWG